MISVHRLTYLMPTSPWSCLFVFPVILTLRWDRELLCLQRCLVWWNNGWVGVRVLVGVGVWGWGWWWGWGCGGEGGGRGWGFITRGFRAAGGARVGAVRAIGGQCSYLYVKDYLHNIYLCKVANDDSETKYLVNGWRNYDGFCGKTEMQITLLLPPLRRNSTGRSSMIIV